LVPAISSVSQIKITCELGEGRGEEDQPKSEMFWKTSMREVFSCPKIIPHQFIVEKDTAGVIVIEFMGTVSKL